MVSKSEEQLLPKPAVGKEQEKKTLGSEREAAWGKHLMEAVVFCRGTWYT